MTTPEVGGDNPFIVYRRHLDVYHRALGAGMADDAFCQLVAEADERVAEVDGTGFVITPLIELTPGAVDATAGGRPDGWPDRPVMAKVETANVSGSHKARHLFGLLLGHLVGAATSPRSGPVPDLAIASCGNAALGAAVVAASADRRLQVFVPVDADPAVVERLDLLGASVNVCPRQPGEHGDPCIHGLDRAVAAGAEPFTVQGPRCPDVIDGARTLGLELADQLDHLGRQAADLYVQIGGGALATAVMDGLARAHPDHRPPRLHPVQARAAHPYVAGWNQLAPALLADLGVTDPGDDGARADLLARHLPGPRLPEALEGRAALVTPWPTTPASVASGILDDIAYDWRTVMAHQVSSGGWPVLVDEATLVRAASLAADLVSPPPDATGAAGLAGVLADQLATGSREEPGAVVVLLTGVDRRWKPTA